MYKLENLPKKWREKMIVITNRKLCPYSLAKQLEKICLFHPKAVILREKDLTETEYSILGREVRGICGHSQVPCIYHTFADAAIRDKMTQIHLPLWKLRENENWKGRGISLLGTSVHSVEEAEEAQKLGADYLMAGHIYATDCKKDVPPRGVSFLRDVCKSVDLPVYAIGGIRLEGEQIQEVLENGAKGFCVMSELMKAEN